MIIRAVSIICISSIITFTFWNQTDNSRSYISHTSIISIDSNPLLFFITLGRWWCLVTIWRCWWSIRLNSLNLSSSWNLGLFSSRVRIIILGWIRRSSIISFWSLMLSKLMTQNIFLVSMQIKLQIPGPIKNIQVKTNWNFKLHITKKLRHNK